MRRLAAGPLTGTCLDNGVILWRIKNRKTGQEEGTPPERAASPDLYRSGWSLVDIAVFLDRSVREVVEALRQHGIPPKPEHLQEAEAHLSREGELSLVFRKRTPSGKS